MAKKSKPKSRLPAKAAESPPDSMTLLTDLRGLIESARASVAQTVYSAQVVLHWRVGQRILVDILKHQRATYGDAIVANVASQLSADYGRGFTEKSLRRMIQFADVFPDPEIVAALSRQLRIADSITSRILSPPGGRGSAVLRNLGSPAPSRLADRGCGVPQTPATLVSS